MQTLSVGQLKSNLSEVLKKVRAGEENAISYGRKKEIVARLVPTAGKKEKRRIGILEGKGTVVFKDDFKMAEEEFLSLPSIF